MTDKPNCPNCGSSDTEFKKKASQWECAACEQRFTTQDSSSRPQRIFLSYGHDDNTPLVKALHDRLEAAGHQVWIDQAQIKAGDDWRLAIKKGLLESDRVLSFLSKHSTRDPGVCLDEIGIALAHRHGAIATLLVEPILQVSPPPSIAHIQFLDLSKWRDQFAQGEAHWSQWLDTQSAILLDIISRNAGFAGQMDELQRLLTPLGQGGRLGTLIERGFVGREWLFANIESWRSQSDQSGFWLMSDPGMGKSSIAARLAHTAARHTVAYHFCRFDEPGTCNPHTFVCTLAFQLAARLPGYRELVLHAARYPSKPLAELQADELFTLLLTNPLRYSIDGGQSSDRLLVIVDALDEAPAIASLLAKRQNEFPAWVALLLTSRPDANIRSAFAGLEPTALTSDDPRNLTDLHTFLDQWFATLASAPPADARDLLLERSQGNILYLATARAGVANGSFNLNAPSVYPLGLGGLYRQWFDRQFAGDAAAPLWKASYALLELMCASPEPLPMALARQTLNWLGQDKMAATRPLGSLVQEHQGVFELFHRSLAEWLQDPVLADRYWVNAEDGRIRLAQTLWTQLPDLLQASTASYAHCVLPNLLLAIPADRRKEVLGTDAQRFEHLKQFDDALKEYQDFKIRLARLDLAKVRVEECQAHYGEVSEQALESMSDLANLLLDVTSDFTQARVIFERVLAIREQALGPDHPDTATSLNNLAGLLDTTGDYDAARPLYERALAISEQALGPDHPNTATSLNNLAYLLVTTGDYDAARPLYERALAIREQALGPDHPSTVNSLQRLGVLLRDKGDLTEAEPLLRELLKRQIQNGGAESVEVASALSALGELLRLMGKKQEAEECLSQALGIYSEKNGADHKTTLLVVSRLDQLRHGAP
jgi:tetratricopeptide (TPR) repeat protein